MAFLGFFVSGSLVSSSSSSWSDFALLAEQPPHLVRAPFFFVFLGSESGLISVQILRRFLDREFEVYEQAKKQVLKLWF